MSRPPAALHPQRRYLRLHRRVFSGGVAVLLLAAFVAEDGSHFIWPVLVWGFAFFVHYLYVKSLGIDDDWAARRAAEVTGHAYDAGHIDIIRERYEKDASGDRAGNGGKP